LGKARIESVGVSTIDAVPTGDYAAQMCTAHISARHQA